MTETDLLVIVPHEDDELAIAGAMIYGAVQFDNMHIHLYMASVLMCVSITSSLYIICLIYSRGAICR